MTENVHYILLVLEAFKLAEEDWKKKKEIENRVLAEGYLGSGRARMIEMGVLGVKSRTVAATCPDLKSQVTGSFAAFP